MAVAKMMPVPCIGTSCRDYRFFVHYVRELLFIQLVWGINTPQVTVLTDAIS